MSKTEEHDAGIESVYAESSTSDQNIVLGKNVITVTIVDLGGLLQVSL